MPVQLNGADLITSFSDYEEGVFTPQLGDQNLNGTGECQAYTTQVGLYTKVGRVVTFTIRLTMSSVGSLATRLNILGLPFVSNATTFADTGVAVGLVNNAAITAGYSVSGVIFKGTSHIQLELSDATTGTTVLAPAELSDDGLLILGGSYFV